jgi:hypothetical protein
MEVAIDESSGSRCLDSVELASSRCCPKKSPANKRSRTSQSPGGLNPGQVEIMLGKGFVDLIGGL